MPKGTVMKTWACLILALMVFTAGCAEGYYAKGPAYEAPWEKMEPMTFSNPETPAEQERRIWSEDAGR
jgi:hypothetical protein